MTRKPKTQNSGPDLQEWLEQLTELAKRLRSELVTADPILWAAACSVESAALMLQAHGPLAATDRHDVLLDAVSSSRAAVVAATTAAARSRDAR